jgi:hypothetical protein
MRPYPEEVLRAIQSGVVAHFAPELKSTYGTAQFAFSMLLFTIVQRDFDSAAADLVDANAALRDLLASVSAALPNVDGTDARAAAATVADLPAAAPSLRLSALRAENEALRQIICHLTPLIEPAADDPALAALKPVREKIYAHLSADAKRRIFPILSA